MERETYYITDRCIGCGTCLSLCPAGCIAGGRPPFVIRAGYCVRCGRCREKCPVGAVLRRVYEAEDAV